MVLIESFNPYGEQYPDRRVISRRELDVLKLLVAEGLDVRVAGDPSHELNFLSTKGVREFLSDPLILTLVGVPLSIATGIVSNVLYGLFAKQKPTTEVVLELDDNGSRAHYRSDGVPLERQQFDALLRAMQERRRFHSSGTPRLNGVRLQSPYPEKPVPIFLEHTDRVVGWGAVLADEELRGLRVEEAVITDAETMQRINEGSLKGFSIGLLVREARCEICGRSYFDCKHIGGQMYDGTLCLVRLTSVNIGEISIVENPANPWAEVKLKSGPDPAL